MILDQTSRTLEAFLDNTGTDVIFTVDYIQQKDKATDTGREFQQITASNGTNVVTVLSAPPENVTSKVTKFNAYNGNSATRIITVQIDTATANTILNVISLATTESAVWTPTAGWQVVT